MSWFQHKISRILAVVSPHKHQTHEFYVWVVVYQWLIVVIICQLLVWIGVSIIIDF